MFGLRRALGFLLGKIPLLQAGMRELLAFAGALFALLIPILKSPAKLAIKVIAGNKIVSLVVFAGIVLIAALLVGSDDNAEPATELVFEDRPNYTIGAILSLSGELERQGNEMRRGYEVAIAAYNDSGGIVVDGIPHNLTLVIYDDESSVARASVVARLLFANDAPMLLLGPYSSALSEPVARIANENQVPVVLPIASAAGIPVASNTYLIQTPPAKHLVDAARVFAAFVREKKAALVKDEERFVNGSMPKVVIFSLGDAHSTAVVEGVRAELRKVGDIELVDFDPTLPEEEYLEAIKSLGGVDAVFVSAYGNGARRLMETIGAEGLNIPFLAMTHCEVARITRLDPTAAEGALCALHWLPGIGFGSSSPLPVNVFENSYYETHGSRPSHHAAAAAAAIQVIAKAIVLSDTRGIGIGQSLSETDIDSFYGPIKFDAGGNNMAKPMVLSQVTQSRYVPVAPPQLAKRNALPRPTLAASN